MGGTSSQTQQQTQTSAPWAPAEGALSGILSNAQRINPNLNRNERGAIDRLSGMGAAGNPYAPALGSLAGSVFAGGGAQSQMANDAYAQYQRMLNPFASGQYVDPSQNPELQKYLQVARDDVAGNINQQFAGAGCDLSGANSQALGRGIMQAEAPILMDAYNQARGQQLGAINSLYGAGGQTAGLLAGLDQSRVGTATAAAGAANEAQLSGPMLQLQAEAQRRGIPLQTLAAQMGIVLPAGQAFGTTTGTREGTSTDSGMRQFAQFGQGLSGVSGGMQTAFGPGGWLFGQPQKLLGG